MARGPYNENIIQQIEEQIDKRLSSFSFSNKKKIELRILFFNPTTLPLGQLILKAIQQRYLEAGWKKIKITKEQGRLYAIYLGA